MLGTGLPMSQGPFGPPHRTVKPSSTRGQPDGQVINYNWIESQCARIVGSKPTSMDLLRNLTSLFRQLHNNKTIPFNESIAYIRTKVLGTCSPDMIKECREHLNNSDFLPPEAHFVQALVNVFNDDKDLALSPSPLPLSGGSYIEQLNRCDFDSQRTVFPKGTEINGLKLARTVIRGQNNGLFELINSVTESDIQHLPELADFRHTKDLGVGTFGRVRLGRNIRTGELVAVKKIRQDIQNEQKIAKMVSKFDSLNHIQAPMDYCLADGKDGKQKSYVFSSLMPNGSCKDLLKNIFKGLLSADRHGVDTQPLTDVQTLCHFDMCSIVAEAHEHSIYRLDYKPANIMMDSNGCLKLVDIGSLTQTDDALQGSPEFMPPEIFVKLPPFFIKQIAPLLNASSLEHLGSSDADRPPQFNFSKQDFEKWDAWSLGISLLAPNDVMKFDKKTLLMANSATLGDHIDTTLNEMFRDNPKYYSNAHFQSLIRGLLCYDSSQRLTASDALQSPYFDGVEGLSQARSDIQSMQTSNENRYQTLLKTCLKALPIPEHDGLIINNNQLINPTVLAKRCVVYSKGTYYELIDNKSFSFFASHFPNEPESVLKAFFKKYAVDSNQTKLNDSNLFYDPFSECLYIYSEKSGLSKFKFGCGDYTHLIQSLKMDSRSTFHAFDLVKSTVLPHTIQKVNDQYFECLDRQFIMDATEPFMHPKELLARSDIFRLLPDLTLGVFINNQFVPIKEPVDSATLVNELNTLDDSVFPLKPGCILPDGTLIYRTILRMGPGEYLERLGKNPQSDSLLVSKFPLLKDHKKMVGSGSFSEVKLIRRFSADDDEILVKKVVRPSSNINLVTILTEGGYLETLSNDSFVPNYYGNTTLDNGMSEKVYLLQEFIQGTQLSNVLKSNTLDMKSKKDIFKQLLKAVVGMDDRNLYHNDLKPENIMIDSQGVLKLVDFGSTTNREAGAPNHVTVAYRPPGKINFDLKEGDHHIRYKYQSWSLGMIFLKMVTGESAFKSAFKHLPFDDIRPSWLSGCLFTKDEKRSERVQRMSSEVWSTLNSKSLSQPLFPFQEWPKTSNDLKTYFSNLSDECSDWLDAAQTNVYALAIVRLLNSMSEEQQSLFCSLTRPSIEDRLTAGAAINHSFFTNVT